MCKEEYVLSKDEHLKLTECLSDLNFNSRSPVVGERSVKLCEKELHGLSVDMPTEKQKQLKDFLFALNSRGIRIIRHDDSSNMLMEALSDFKKKVATITSEIAAKACQVKDGTCVRTRKEPDKKFCCCNECGWAVGYLRQLRTSDIDMYAEKWDNERGFNGKEGGCSLPREKRALTCLYYLCEDAQKNVSEFELNVLYMIGTFKEYL